MINEDIENGMKSLIELNKRTRQVVDRLDFISFLLFILVVIIVFGVFLKFNKLV